MKSWREFEGETPELATATRRLLGGSDGLPIGFLATASASGVPHLAPVCPIFCRDDLYLSAAGRSPKVRDLRENPRYVLHAFLGENDEEAQVAGATAEVDDETERAAVHEAIPFPAFNRDDPIFRLSIERALWVHWERVGQPDTKPVRRRWRVGG